MYNYDLASLTQQSEDSLATVASVTEAVTSVVRRLGWDRAGVTLVMFNTGVTQRVTDSLVTEAEVCVRRVIHLNLNYLTSPAWRYLASLHKAEEDLNIVLVSQTTDQVLEMFNNLAEELGGWSEVRLARYLAWSYLQTNDHLADLAEDLPPGLRLHLLAEAGQALDPSTGPVGVAGGLMESLSSSLAEYSARHCPDTRSVLACVDQFRSHLSQHGQETVAHLSSLNYNILRLNNIEAGVFAEDEPLYILAGEWAGQRLVMYEEAGADLEAERTHGGQCLNSTEDYTAQLVVMIQSQTKSNIETLWGSIALGICIFGVLIVVISAFYFIIAVNRKQKTEYGSSKDHTRLLHYLMILGLIVLFLSPIPWVIEVNLYTCILRHAAPTLAFSIVLARSEHESYNLRFYFICPYYFSLLVNLIATFRQTIYTVNPTQVWKFIPITNIFIFTHNPSDVKLRDHGVCPGIAPHRRSADPGAGRGHWSGPGPPSPTRGQRHVCTWSRHVAVECGHLHLAAAARPGQCGHVCRVSQV